MKMLYYCVWPNYSDDYHDWLDYALFEPYNDEIRYLRQIRRNARLEHTQSLQLVY
jgi:hypothetical protein